MTVTTEDIKNSLRVQTTTDDALISNYLTAAQDYVLNAVDSTATVDKLQVYSQFDIAVAMLTEFWYQSRGAVTTASQELPYSVVSMIQQLRGLFAVDI